jgi:Fe-S cluster assembly protein SufD
LWSYDLRKRAWEYYQASAIPDRVSHLWRYTDPNNFEIEKPERIYVADPEQSSGGNGDGDAEMIRLEPFSLYAELAEKGIIYKSLLSAVAENEKQVKKHLGTLVGTDFGRYESLNMALWDNGLFLFVPDNTVLETPIILGHEIPALNSFTRTLIIIGNNSQVTILNDLFSASDRTESVFNSAVEIFAGDNSIVKPVNLQRSGENTRGTLTYRARIGRDSNIHSIFGGFGGATIKLNAGIELAARGGNSRMDGIIFADGNQSFDYHTRHHHIAGDSFSDLDFKVVLKDRARSAYTGLIRIENDALNCEAYQENRNLLLNDGTKAESIPELEILTDQVRCTHGATMGPIDPEMIFYLRSRGLTENEAIKSVVNGFANTILERVPGHVAESIRKIVSEKLEGS